MLACKRWVLLVCIVSLWIGGETSASAQWIKRSGISLWNIHQTWKEVRTLLVKHSHVQSRPLFATWKRMSQPVLGITPFTPKGHLTPEWFADARRGRVWINVTYLKSLRRQFNNALHRRRKKVKAVGDLDMTGSWGNVWQGLVLQQQRRSKLRLLFALKLLPGYEYARCRALYQRMLKQRHGVSFSEETFEVTLLCLEHKRKVLQAIAQHPILRQVWKLVTWPLIDHSILRLQGKMAFVPRGFSSTPIPPAICATPQLSTLAAFALFAARRDTCSFCPAYSLHPTDTNIWINLIRRGRLFILNREHYRSLVFGSSSELHRLMLRQWRNHFVYATTFLQNLRAKGGVFMQERRAFERNLMVDQVKQYNGYLREHLRTIRRDWAARTIRVFYQGLLMRTFRAPLAQIKACIRANEQQWLRHATPYLYEWVHP